MELYEALFVIPAISMLLGTIGILRFKKFMMKLQAATMINVGGVMLSLLLFCIYAPSPQMRAKTFFLLLLMFLTSPVSTHFIARCYYHTTQTKTSKKRS